MSYPNYYIGDLNEEEFPLLVDFQCTHLPIVMQPEERYQHGYLPYVLTVKSINAATRLRLSHGAFSGRKFRPIGFACGLSYTMARNVSYLEPLTREFSSTDQYPIFISMCIEKQYRRNSIGSKLMRKIITTAQEQKFVTAVVDIGLGNDIASEFLKFHGFSQIQFPLLSDRIIYSKTLTKPTPFL